VPPLKLTYDYISQNFGWSTVAKARHLCKENAVLEWGFDIYGTKVLAHVRESSRGNPCRVELNLFEQEGNGEACIKAQCSCSAERGCAHPAAVALTILQDTDHEVMPLDEDLAEHDNDSKITSAAHAHPSVTATWLTSLESTFRNISTADGEQESIIYLIYVESRQGTEQLLVEPRVAMRLKSGGYGSSRAYNWRQLANGRARFIDSIDRSIARLWSSMSPRDFLMSPGRPLLPPDDRDIFDLLMKRILSTGRACHKLPDGTSQPLKLGSPKQAKFEWVLHTDARQSTRIVPFEEGLLVLPSVSPWYLDLKQSETGPLKLPYEFETQSAFLSAPRIAPGDVDQVRLALQEMDETLPLPQLDVVEEERRDPPVPCLELKYVKYRHQVFAEIDSQAKYVEGETAALLNFDYGFDTRMLAGSWQTYRFVENGKSVIRHRDTKFEVQVENRLLSLGLQRSRHSRDEQAGESCAQSCWVVRKQTEDSWLNLVQETLPILRQEGWKIVTDPSFQFQVLEAEQDWELEVDQRSAFWFSFNLGVKVDGERVSLLPIMMEALHRIRKEQFSPSLPFLDSLNKHGKFHVPLPDGRLLALPFERVQGLLNCLIELLDKQALSADGRLSVSTPHLMALQDSGFVWGGPNSLQSLIEHIKTFTRTFEPGEDGQGLPPIETPIDFAATLRPYQIEGLRWLEFISTPDLHLGGVLADDMGLGKTVQVLAHLVRQKDLGRLAGPCLVICPTSVVPNWLSECTKFAPHLNVVSLTGSDRNDRFVQVSGADLVLSTYPLIVRDKDVLAKVRWQAIFLDEAQAVKNHNTKCAQAVCDLEAQYRVCLTGTPVENHLGEFWSQFNFLMPGYLGTRQMFERSYQTPIEEGGDMERLKLLCQRIGPFVLRRTKDKVARDLPEKTVIVKHVELEGQQRDLYETVRLSTQDQVLSEVRARGIASCQLIILDALLKLRQVCCDPRLVKLQAASKVSESAKLETLISMVGQLLEEKRRLLIFSQFTGMLDLIAQALRKEEVAFVELRGDTKDRATPVRQFQQGEVPVFLISLKAGGTGLNLTAADTVIHYDPWWNPAVEEQANDRAHRIGQDKPVFVYRLVTAGSIEEQILSLQEQKRAIASSLLDGVDSNSIEKMPTFNDSDLAALFAPLK
jgi:hypothetical protein